LKIKATAVKMKEEEVAKREKAGLLSKLVFGETGVASITLRYFPYWIGKVSYEKNKKPPKVGLMALADQTKISTPILTEFTYGEVDVDEGMVVNPKLKPSDATALIIKGAENWALTKKKDPTIFFGKAKLTLVDLTLVYRPFWDVQYAKGGGRYYEADGYFTRW